MIIDKILILACDRPHYLKKTLDSVINLNIKIDVFVDIPNKTERFEGHHEVLDLLKNYNVNVFINEKHLGCTASMLNVLKNRGDGEIFMILEDDIVLNNNSIYEINKILKDVYNKPFILKLNDFFWGWVTNSKTLNIIDELINGNDIDEVYKNNIYYQKIKIFKQKNIPYIWDEMYQESLNFYDIQEIKLDKYLTTNIGLESTRLSNPQDIHKSYYIIFVDGQIKNIDTI